MTDVTKYGPPINISSDPEFVCLIHLKCAIDLYNLYPLTRIRFFLSLLPGNSPIPLIDIHNLHPFMPFDIISMINPST